eukprot:GHVR01169815.1.p1 GENE.GHVR01169815.1~~GHVR01169815.1.p1  ORF type:complete len:270 (+),score=29.26 GHVR01169815.1:501-1310(+)
MAAAAKLSDFEVGKQAREKFFKILEATRELDELTKEMPTHFHYEKLELLRILGEISDKVARPFNNTAVGSHIHHEEIGRRVVSLRIVSFPRTKYSVGQLRSMVQKIDWFSPELPKTAKSFVRNHSGNVVERPLPIDDIALKIDGSNGVETSEIEWFYSGLQDRGIEASELLFRMKYPNRGIVRNYSLKLARESAFESLDEKEPMIEKLKREEKFESEAAELELQAEIKRTRMLRRYGEDIREGKTGTEPAIKRRKTERTSSGQKIISII